MAVAFVESQYVTCFTYFMSRMKEKTVQQNAEIQGLRLKEEKDKLAEMKENEESGTKWKRGNEKDVIKINGRS